MKTSLQEENGVYLILLTFFGSNSLIIFLSFHLDDCKNWESWFELYCNDWIFNWHCWILGPGVMPERYGSPTHLPSHKEFSYFPCLLYTCPDLAIHLAGLNLSWVLVFNVFRLQIFAPHSWRCPHSPPQFNSKSVHNVM